MTSFSISFLYGTSHIEGIIFQSEREAKVTLCPHGEPDPGSMSKPQGYPKVTRGNSIKQPHCFAIDEAEQKSCSFLLGFSLRFLT